MWLQPDKCYLFEVQTIYQDIVSNLKYWTRKLLVQFVAESVRAICLPIWPNFAWMGLMRSDGRLLITPDDSLQVWWHHHHWCGKHKLIIFVQCSHGHEPFTKVENKKENNYWKSVRLHCWENKDNNGKRISDPPQLKDTLSSKAKRNGYQSACYRVVVSLLQVILAKLGSTRGRSRLGHTPSEHHLGRRKTSNAMNS